MEEKKLYIVMVGLPARGKSVIASRLKENLVKDGIRTQIFNNGDLRRKLTGKDTSDPEFYHPENKEGVDLREKIALINIRRAKEYLLRNGLVAILDATNVSFKRREMISHLLTDHPLLFIECINYNEEILEASIQRKIILPEFNHLEKETASRSFKQRISYYDSIYSTIKKSEGNYIKLDSLNNRIIEEDIREEVPYYERIRDFLVTDSIRNLFLIRHGETFFNLENRIGGNSCLTERGVKQAKALAIYFQKKKIPVIFTSKKQRTIQTAEPIKQLQSGSKLPVLGRLCEPRLVRVTYAVGHRIAQNNYLSA